MKEKPITLDDMMSALPEDRRLRIEGRAAAEVEEIHALRAIREAAGATQEELARRLGINQTAVSKLERRKGMSMANLVRVVNALGGEVDIAVRLAGREPVRIVQKGGKFEILR
jgi:DNA-binding XRE family transcriptional regulator